MDIRGYRYIVYIVVVKIARKIRCRSAPARYVYVEILDIFKIRFRIFGIQTTYNLSPRSVVAVFLYNSHRCELVVVSGQVRVPCRDISVAIVADVRGKSDFDVVVGVVAPLGAEPCIVELSANVGEFERLEVVRIVACCGGAALYVGVVVETVRLLGIRFTCVEYDLKNVLFVYGGVVAEVELRSFAGRMVAPAVAVEYLRSSGIAALFARRRARLHPQRAVAVASAHRFDRTLPFRRHIGRVHIHYRGDGVGAVESRTGTF